MWFVVTPYGGKNKPFKRFPFARLIQDNWDDYGYKTTFSVILHLSESESLELGTVKIIKADQDSGFTPVPDEQFEYLSDEFASLGGSLEYYESLFKLGSAIYRPYLSGLQDVTFNEEHRIELEDDEGYRVSLLRFSGAESTVKDASALFRQRRRRPTRKSGISIRLRTKLASSAKALTASFDFTAFGDLPNRINALIGYNGTGKTRLLSNLATATSGYGYDRKEDHLAQRAGRFVGDAPPFKTVIVVSYSAFDAFAIPGRTRIEQDKIREDRAFFGYIYCGLRELTEGEDDGEDFWSDDDDVSYRLKQSIEIIDEFRQALDRIHKIGRRDEFREILKILLQDASFERIGLAHLLDRNDRLGAVSSFRRLSSGHKIVLKIVAELTAYVDGSEPTLVLIDEPETHLHPPLLAALLRCVRECLERFDAYAIIATHSPVVLQETPGRYVRYLKRVGSRSVLGLPRIETFGEDIGILTQDVFNLDEGKTDWHQTLREIANKVSFDDVLRLFDNRLGFSARSYVISVEEGDGKVL